MIKNVDIFRLKQLYKKWYNIVTILGIELFLVILLLFGIYLKL